MKLYLYVLLFMAVGLGCTRSPNSDSEKASYAVGYQFGQNLKQQNPTYDPGMVAQGLKDSWGGKSRLSAEQMQDALMKMQIKAIEQQHKDTEFNQTRSKEFLEKNKNEKGIQVTKSGLQYLVMRSGSGKTPTINDIVKINFKGTLLDGSVFESSMDRGQPASLPVKGVIPGWSEAFLMMKEGQKMRIFVPPSLGYGNMTRPNIPGGSVLIFDLELLEVSKK